MSGAPAISGEVGAKRSVRDVVVHGLGEPGDGRGIAAAEPLHDGVAGAAPGQVEIDQRAVLVEEEAGEGGGGAVHAPRTSTRWARACQGRMRRGGQSGGTALPDGRDAARAERAA